MSVGLGGSRRGGYTPLLPELGEEVSYLAEPVPAPAGARASLGEPGRPRNRSNLARGRHECRLAAGQ